MSSSILVLHIIMLNQIHSLEDDLGEKMLKLFFMICHFMLYKLLQWKTKKHVCDQLKFALLLHHSCHTGCVLVMFQSNIMFNIHKITCFCKLDLHAFVDSEKHVLLRANIWWILMSTITHSNYIGKLFWIQKDIY
jgi:hypothetical protein